MVRILARRKQAQRSAGRTKMTRSLRMRSMSGVVTFAAHVARRPFERSAAAGNHFELRFAIRGDACRQISCACDDARRSRGEIFHSIALRLWRGGGADFQNRGCPGGVAPARLGRPQQRLPPGHDCCVTATVSEHLFNHAACLLLAPLFSHTPP